MDDQPLQLRVFTGEDHSPCTNCAAGCCRSFVVPLTGSDMMRVQRGLGLSFWDFVARWDDPTGAISRGVAPHFRFEDLPEGRFVIGLLHKPSQAFPDTTRCRFLSETTDASTDSCETSNCSIYAHRPLACRIYPAQIGADGEAYGREIPEFGRPEPHEAYRLCPRVWESADFNVDDVQRDLRQVTDEMQKLHVVAQYWNREPRPWTVFPEFLQHVYDADAQTATRRAA